MSDRSRGCKEERPQGLGGWRRRCAYAAKEAYGSLRRRCLAPLGLTSTRLQKRRPEEEKGEDYQGGSTEALQLWLRVGGYGSASNARRRAPDAGSATALVPKALTRSDGEHSDKESQARV